MKKLHNSFQKQNTKPIHLYNASTCCCSCCCILTPMGNLVADKIVAKISRAEKTRWMTCANILFAAMSLVGSISIFVAIDNIVTLPYNNSLSLSCSFMGLGFYYYLLFWYSKKWLPEANVATRIKFSLMQWVLSTILMAVFFGLSILILIGSL